MAVFRQLIIMHLNEAFDRLLDRLHLQQRHLVIFGEKLKSFDGANVFEGFHDGIFCRGWRDIGQVQRRRGREDVGVVLASRLLEAMQSRVAEVLGQTGIRLSLLWHLHLGVFGCGDSNLFAP